MSVPLFHIDSSINSLMLCTMFMCVFWGVLVFFGEGAGGGGSVSNVGRYNLPGFSLFLLVRFFVWWSH